MKLVQNKATGKVTVVFGNSVIEPSRGRKITRPLAGLLSIKHPNVWIVYTYGGFHDSDCEACQRGSCAIKISTLGPEGALLRVEHDMAAELN